MPADAVSSTAGTFSARAHSTRYALRKSATTRARTSRPRPIVPYAAKKTLRASASRRLQAI